MHVVEKIKSCQILTTLGINSKKNFSLHEKSGLVLEFQLLKEIKDCVMGICLSSITPSIHSFIRTLVECNELGDEDFLYELYIGGRIKNFFIDRQLQFASIISLHGDAQCVYETNVNGLDYISIMDNNLNVVFYLEIPSKLENKNHVLQALKQITSLI